MTQKIKIDRFPDGRVRGKYWYLDGVLHREDGPAVLAYDSFGSLNTEVWWNHGRIHRVGGPAVVNYLVEVKRSDLWYSNNTKHREDGPAVIVYDEKGNVEREEWWLSGDMRRFTTYVGGHMLVDVWKEKDKYHREDGPAITRHEGYGTPYLRWFLENVEIQESKFAEELDNYLLRKVMES